MVRRVEAGGEVTIKVFGLKEPGFPHAYRHPIGIWDLGDGFAMTVGATATASILEVGSIEGETAVVIVHAVRAREKFLT